MLIQNGTIFTMAGRIIDNGCVLAQRNRITAVEEYIDPTRNGDDVVIDAKGKWVMPGLIEAHCHVGISEDRKGVVGDDSNEATDPVTPYVKAIDAINPMDAAFHSAIRGGITGLMIGPGSANVVGGQFVFLKARGRCVDDMVVLEPAAMKVAFGENPKGQYGPGRTPSTRMGIGYLLRQELFAAQQYLARKKEAAEKGEPFEADYRYECWEPVFEKKIPLKAHVHRADDIQSAIRIAKAFDVEMTLDHCTEGHLIWEKVKESGFPAIVGPSLATRNKTEIQYADFKTSGILHKEGVLVAVTTDYPASLIQCLPLCAGLAVRDGLPMEEGLKAITINAAKICRVDARLGSLEVGKDADIAIFDGNPLSTFTNCLYTIIDAEVVYNAEESGQA